MRFGLSEIVINDICSVFRRHRDIESVVIFGSRAKGTYHDGSDVDLAVVGKDLTYNQLLDIKIEIDDLDLLYKVDVLDYMKYKDSPIGRHIDRVGKLFYSKG